ncbi:MAG: hypothetical protein HDT26_04505 [Subdoligranulum sp.]|nr:hypothetical protein [Subdoligranulum sp.]
MGTILGFALAVLLTLQRTVELSRRDSALLKIVKTAGRRLEMLYMAVIRGTPMMVQACIIYYSGFAAAKALMPGASITERVQFNEIPPHVEYSFTQKGRDLMPVFYAMMNWDFAYDEENEAIEKP